MSEIYNTGSKGERLLAEYLTAQGRTVKAGNKTFDLVVDGVYAEVKSSKKPYAALGFVGLTDKQFGALQSGERFSLFLVCNLDDPSALEIIEISSDRLREHQPKKESTYYWYRPQLDAMSGRRLTSA